LTRPPKIFGLPIGFFVSLMLASVIPFVAANDWRFLLIGVVGYSVLWFVADRNPNLFETVAVNIGEKLDLLHLVADVFRPI